MDSRVLQFKTGENGSTVDTVLSFMASRAPLSSKGSFLLCLVASMQSCTLSVPSSSPVGVFSECLRAGEAGKMYNF